MKGSGILHRSPAPGASPVAKEAAMTRLKKTGFTLIELLVVIAIIAILAAILFPVFAKAREKARQNACLSNQKQVSRAMLLYLGDNDELYPGYTLVIGPYTGWLWETGLKP